MNKETMIQVACRWLEDNAHKYLAEIICHGRKITGLSITLVSDFKRAMEESL